MSIKRIICCACLQNLLGLGYTLDTNKATLIAYILYSIVMDIFYGVGMENKDRIIWMKMLHVTMYILFKSFLMFGENARVAKMKRL